ncbi:urotensin-2B isoform X2 [Mirounga leonina]|uniref:urotensin-2B isoform X2 n=1 Tax=Mirounga leonina TaxID=9715 RepID=UPI00156C0154|nr:urotensin-2B isoform X2 [Mirounga leonina]
MHLDRESPVSLLAQKKIFNMNKILSATVCFGLLTLLSVLIFLELVHGRPYLIQGNELFPDKEDTNREELLLALLNKNFDFQRPSNIDRELANKLEELNQLKEQFMEAKDAEISYAIDGLSSSHPNKRACFWKYCV